MDIEHRLGPVTFKFRAAGLFLHEGHVLLHRSDADSLWCLPGGCVRAGETSEQGLRRELREELGAEIAVGPLQWVVESFLRSDEGRRQEVAFYYQADFLDPARYDLAQTFRGTETGDLGLTFRWVPIARIDQVPDLVPPFLYRELKALPGPLRHIVETER